MCVYQCVDLLLLLASCIKLHAGCVLASATQDVVCVPQCAGARARVCVCVALHVCQTVSVSVCQCVAVFVFLTFAACLPGSFKFVPVHS